MKLLRCGGNIEKLLNDGSLEMQDEVESVEAGDGN